MAPQQTTTSPLRAEASSGLREGLLAAIVLLGAWTALLSEVLGLGHWLDRLPLAIAWGAGLIAALVFIWRRRRPPRDLRLLPPFSLDHLWLAVPLIHGVTLLVIALVAPPNTNDSLQYHMSRVAHWAQQRSLAHYATPIGRQLWMPPFAEIAALQLYILAGSDRLVNLVQWGSMLASLLAVSLIAARLGASRLGQVMAVLSAVTLPMGILQATSTQNDYVTALWAVALAYYALKAHQVGLGTVEWGLAGLAVGLGLLTKGTFAGFAIPLLAWMGVATLRKAGWASTTRSAFLGLGLVLLLNAGAWSRNLRTYGGPLGPRGAIRTHGNEVISLRTVISNMVRGSTLHLATPYGDLNGPIRDVVTAFHDLLGMDVNDPRTTMGEYRVKRSFHEDYAGNPFHFILVSASIVGVFWRRPGEARGGPRPAAGVYALAVVGMYVAFSALYKWQPTGSRLQLAVFVAAAPLAGVAFERIMEASQRRSFRLAAYAAAAMLVLTSLRPLLLNPSRPLLPRAEDHISLWNTSRQELMFINTPEIMPGYLPLIEVARGRGCTSIGLKIDSSHPEYPFWALLAPPRSGIRLNHIEIDPPPGGYVPPDEPCAILCTYCTEASLHGMDLVFNHERSFSLYEPAGHAP
jgi:hypothetical protein